MSLEIIRQLHLVLNEIFTKEFLDSDPVIQRQVHNVPLSLPTNAIYQVLQKINTSKLL